MATVFVNYPFRSSNVTKSLFVERNGVNGIELYKTISIVMGIDDFCLYCNGKEVTTDQHVLPDSIIYVHLNLPGGKGGFGSMLRAIGAQIEKTTNREACRDLSGRRLRDINEEQRLKKWISKKAEREAEKIRRRKERLERLKSQPKHNFVDFEYEKEISELPERIDDALTAGMEKIKKRPVDDPSTSTGSKKKKLWLEEDFSDSSNSDSDVAKSEIAEDESHTTKEVENYLSSPIAETSCESIVAVDEASKPCDDPVISNDTQVSEFPELSKLPEVSDALTLKCHDVTTDKEIDLMSLLDVKEVESLGLDTLKKELMRRGLKCGGSLTDRAGRLWAIRGLEPNQYPKDLFSKRKK